MNPAYNIPGQIKSFFFMMLLCMQSTISHAQWESIAPGIQFRDLNKSLSNPWSHIYAFKIDLSGNQLSLRFASELSSTHASVQRLARTPDILLATNGGFFDKQFRPLGLRISQGIRKNPRKKISWWGIFYINNNQAFIASPNQRIPKQASFAIQSGPRLLVNNRIPPLKKGMAERTAIGIIDKQHIVILVTDNHRLSTHQLAKIMSTEPLNCEQAINLDGGSSSQLLAKTNNFHLSVNGFSNISDAIVITKRN